MAARRCVSQRKEWLLTIEHTVTAQPPTKRERWVDVGISAISVWRSVSPAATASISATDGAQFQRDIRHTKVKGRKPSGSIITHKSANRNNTSIGTRYGSRGTLATLAEPDRRRCLHPSLASLSMAYDCLVAILRFFASVAAARINMLSAQ